VPLWEDTDAPEDHDDAGSLRSALLAARHPDAAVVRLRFRDPWPSPLALIATGLRPRTRATGLIPRRSSYNCSQVTAQTSARTQRWTRRTRHFRADRAQMREALHIKSKRHEACGGTLTALAPGADPGALMVKPPQGISQALKQDPSSLGAGNDKPFSGGWPTTRYKRVR